MIDYQRQAQMCSKCTKIIADLSEMYGISLERARDMFYHSQTSQLIEEKVADLHCRSDKYLATLVWDEAHEQSNLH